MKNLYRDNLEIWNNFEERLRDKFYKEILIESLKDHFWSRLGDN